LTNYTGTNHYKSIRPTNTVTFPTCGFCQEILHPCTVHYVARHRICNICQKLSIADCQCLYSDET